MEKIRKIGIAIWYAKEKVVLAVMVGIFLWHVIKIFNPPQVGQAKSFVLPGSTAPTGITGFEPVTAPALKPGPDLAAIYTPHPFWYSGSTTGNPTPTEATTETP